MFDFTTHLSPIETDDAQKMKLLAVAGKLYILEVEDISAASTSDVENAEQFLPEEYGWDEVIVAEAPNRSVLKKTNALGQLEIDLSLDEPVAI
jgi:hypothetical protein